MSLNIGCSFLSSHSGSPVVGLLDIDLMSLWYFCVCLFFFNISPFCYFDQKISRNISLNSPILSSAISTLLLNLSANFFFISVVALFKYRIFKIPFHIFYFCVNNSFLFMNTIFSLFFIVCFTLPLWKHLYELLSCLPAESSAWIHSESVPIDQVLLVCFLAKWPYLLFFVCLVIWG